MKKFLLLVTTGILLINGFGALVFSEDGSSGVDHAFILSVPPLEITDYPDNQLELSFDNSSFFLMEPGAPMVPKIVKIVELPFGALDITVEVIPRDVQVSRIDREIRPSPSSVLLSSTGAQSGSIGKSPEIYTSTSPYPSNWCAYHVGCGLNDKGQRVTYLVMHLFPVRYIPPSGILYVAGELEVSISYDEPDHNPFPAESTQDLLIIAPSDFSDALQPLIDHKNAHGVGTTLVTTEEIYSEYSGFDKPEQIKYCIKDSIEKLGITYVLLVGGVKSAIWAKPRDDPNQGTQGWHVPVRYNNLYDNPEHPLAEESIHDPGVISDLYYADIYREGGLFEDWDTNNDGIFAAQGRPDTENDTGIDLFPDVYVGRLACCNIREVQNIVDKIIAYEDGPIDPAWFNKIVVVSGDGFLDQEDLDFQWNVNSLPDGEYTIYGQSTNKDGVPGPLDIIDVTVDSSSRTSLSFNHDDHLKIDSYPFPPVTEITSPSKGDVLGSTDYQYKPTEGEAYCNDFTGWANVTYLDGIMHIRGKSYDPQPYGDMTNVHVWIENSAGETIFSEWRNGTEMYYEGEWVTGEKSLKGQGGALYYMPDSFERVILWTSNGHFTGQDDVIEALSEGSGFVFFSGHGSPGSWGDHFPGVPGNRQHGSVTGLVNTAILPPFFPMDTISNTGKPFVCVVGGCHNSQFNVSLGWSMLDLLNKRSMWTFGMPTPECWSWWITRLPERGAIATIGNTGLGYGILGKDCTIGGFDGWISKEFFRHYGEENQDILGETYGQTIISYLGIYDMQEDDHIKSVEQWALLGDPSLKIGGYTD